MDWLEAVLVAAALVAGLTGTWSPCGFSMIETIGPVGHTGGRPTTAAACITFVAGALVGGVATFGALGALGALAHGADDRVAYALAAAVVGRPLVWPTGPIVSIIEKPHGDQVPVRPATSAAATRTASSQSTSTAPGSGST